MRIIVIALILLACTVGCRSQREALKPAPTAERLVEPPRGDRYDSPDLPREVMDRTGERPGMADPPKYVGVPRSGIGSPSNRGSGPYGW